ncbi:MAG: peptide deformylase [Desulfobacterales bacterium]|nr:peptide deformylase [Desulfobacterales bacterium]
MAILEILTYPDQFLSRPAMPAEHIDETIQTLIGDMAATLYDAPGVGLAAIQVGYGKRVIVYDISSQDKGRSLQVLINPRIVDMDGEVISENEGCLSVPDFRADVKRASSILVEGLDREENPLSIEADGHLALVLQHEIDHLDGTLFIERISSLKREMYKRRMRKRIKNK